MKNTLPALFLLLTACASVGPLPGRYMVVVDQELAASRWEVEEIVDALREELQEVDLVAFASPAEYDAVIRLDLKNAFGVSRVEYEIAAAERTRKGSVLVGRTTSALLYREYPPDHALEVMRVYLPGPRRFIGWEKVPPAAQVHTVARMIARDIERMR